MRAAGRTDILIDGNKQGENGYQLAVSDMSVSEDGTVSFTQRYSGTDVFASAANIPAIKDIEVIGTNKIFVVCSYTESGKDVSKRFLINAENPEQPEVTDISNDAALSVKNLNDYYYAVGTQGGTINIYKKNDNTSVKEFTGMGQVYGMMISDGKMFASVEKNISVFQLFTTITSTLNRFSVVSLEVTDKDGFSVYDVSPGDLTVTAEIYNPSDTAEQVEMYIAVYSSITDKLEHIQRKSAEAAHGMSVLSDKIQMSSLSDYSAYTRYLKVYIWDSHMKPLTDAYKVNQAELVNGSVWDMYIPEATERVKGIVLINRHGMGIELAGMNAFKAFCAERDLAIMSFFDDAGVLKNFNDKETANTAIFSKIDEFAIKTGHSELSTAPLATFGHSNASAFSAGFAEYNPDRVFAAVIYKSARDDQFEYDTFGEYNIPLFVITGEFDWDYGYIGQLFACERLLEKGALVQYIQDPNSGHFWNDYKSNTLMFEFLDRAYRLKAENAVEDGNGSIVLNQIDRSRGYIGYGEYTVTDSETSKSGYTYKFVPTGYMTYAEYLDYKAENPDFKAQAWLYDEEYAKEWVEFNKNGIIDVDYPYKD